MAAQEQIQWWCGVVWGGGLFGRNSALSAWAGALISLKGGGGDPNWQKAQGTAEV